MDALNSHDQASDAQTSDRVAQKRTDSPLVRVLGRVDYEPTWQAMLAFTNQRDDQTPDELWVCEHPPVFTLGQAGKPEHLLADIGVPLVKIDRGGQITYHGPGQVVVYLLLDLTRRSLRVRELVTRIEQAVIDTLGGLGVVAARKDGAPGVYVSGAAGPGAGLHEAKIAALGLRIRKGCSYHGVSLNVDMDLSPFAAINPCGYAGLAVTQASDLGIDESPARMADLLVRELILQLSNQQLEQA